MQYSAHVTRQKKERSRRKWKVETQLMEHIQIQITSGLRDRSSSEAWASIGYITTTLSGGLKKTPRDTTFARVLWQKYILIYLFFPNLLSICFVFLLGNIERKALIHTCNEQIRASVNPHSSSMKFRSISEWTPNYRPTRRRIAALCRKGVAMSGPPADFTRFSTFNIEGYVLARESLRWGRRL